MMAQVCNLVGDAGLNFRENFLDLPYLDFHDCGIDRDHQIA